MLKDFFVFSFPLCERSLLHRLHLPKDLHCHSRPHSLHIVQLGKNKRNEINKAALLLRLCVCANEMSSWVMTISNDMAVAAWRWLNKESAGKQEILTFFSVRFRDTDKGKSFSIQIFGHAQVGRLSVACIKVHALETLHSIFKFSLSLVI